MSALRPNTNKGHDLGSSSKKWGTAHIGDIQAETGTFSSNVEIQGNLTVTGTQTALSVSTVEATDPLIKLAKDNSSDAIDIGFYGLSNDGSDKYHGLFRDADDGKFYLFKDLATEPTSTVPTLSAGNKAVIVANIEGDITGDMTGNADTASAFQTARTVSFTGGDVEGSFSIDGSADVSAVDLTIQPSSVANSMMINPGITFGDGVTSTERQLGQSLQINGTDDEIEIGYTDGVFTASLATDVSGLSSVSATSFVGALTGNASTATALETSRTLSLSGDVAGSVSFDGTGNANIVSTIQAASVENSMMVNNGLDIFVDGVSQERVQLGEKLDFNGTASQVSVSYSAVDNDLTFSLPSTINVNTSGNAATSTAQETARDFSIDSTEMSAAAVSYDATGNVQLAPSLKSGSVANSKLTNSDIGFGNGITSSDIALGGDVVIQGTSSEVEVGYSAGTFTIGLPDTIAAELTGNASSATALQTARNFSIGSGPVQAAAVSFDGTGNVSLTTSIADDQITNDMLANDKLVIQVDSVDYDRPLGSTLKFAKGGDLTLSYSAVDNEITYNLPSILTADTTGNAATATAQETARDFSISSSEIVASAVSYDATGNVVLVPSIQAGSVANSKLTNSTISVGDGVTSEAISLGGEFEIKGTSNEVEVVWSSLNNDFTIGLPSTITADVSGNASTATALETSRNFNMASTEIVAGSVSFDGTGNVQLSPVIQTGSIQNTKLANDHWGLKVDGVAQENITLGSDVDFVSGQDIDISYSAAANQLTVALEAIIDSDTTGNAATATALETARNIQISGDAAGSASFDGTGDTNIAITIAPDAVENSMILNDHLSFTDGTTSSDVALGGTLTIQGTANECEVAQSGGTYTVGLPSNVSVTNNLEAGGNLTITGGASILGSAVISGQIISSGANLSLSDTLIELGVNNTSAVDHGFYSQRNTSSFCGFAFDETDDKFKAFTATSEPTTTVDTGDAGFAFADIEAGTVEANGNLIGAMRMGGSAPLSGTDTGTAGDLRFDSGFLYICTASNTWKRVAITGF